MRGVRNHRAELLGEQHVVVAPERRALTWEMTDPQLELDVLRPVKRDRRELAAEKPDAVFELLRRRRTDREAQLSSQKRWPVARAQLLLELAHQFRTGCRLRRRPVIALALLVVRVVGVDDAAPHERKRPV